MKYLIILVVLLSIISSVNKKKKKAEQAKRQNAAHPKPDVKPAVPRREDIPSTFTEAEWQAYRAAKMREALEAKKMRNLPDPDAEPAPPAHPAEPIVTAAQPMPAEPPVRDAVVMEGEDTAEHDAHVEHYHAQERMQAAAFAAAREKRFADRKRMRDAVVMSEVLSRPVSLRSRGCAGR